MHVVFGTGPLGKAVMQALLTKNRRVRMVSRSGKADVPADASVVAASAYDPESAIRAARSATVIYQCAQPPYTDLVRKFPALQAVISAGAKFIVGENLYMYGAVNGPIHENLSWNVYIRKEQVRTQMANTVLDAHQKGIVQVAIARGSGVRASVLGKRIFPAMLKGKTAQVVGDIDLPHSYTYIADFGMAMAILGEREQALGETWHVPNAPTRTTREIIEVAFAAAGYETKINSMGKFMMRIGGLFVPEARESVEMMYEFEKPFVVDSSKFVRTFGDIATPFEAGLRSTLNWYKNHLGINTVE